MRHDDRRDDRSVIIPALIWIYVYVLLLLLLLLLLLVLLMQVKTVSGAMVQSSGSKH